MCLKVSLKRRANLEGLEKLRKFDEKVQVEIWEGHQKSGKQKQL